VSSVPYCVRSEPDSPQAIRGGLMLAGQGSGRFPAPSRQGSDRGLLQGNPSAALSLTVQYCRRSRPRAPSVVLFGGWSPISSKESYGVGPFLPHGSTRHLAYRTNNHRPNRPLLVIDGDSFAPAPIRSPKSSAGRGNRAEAQSSASQTSARLV